MDSLFASFLSVIGLFRLVAAIWLRYRSWGWAVLDGIVTLMLGLLLWAGLPWSGLWFLGLCTWNRAPVAWMVCGDVCLRRQAYLESVLIRRVA